MRSVALVLALSGWVGLLLVLPFEARAQDKRVAIRSVRVVDLNGDQDGNADTGGTVNVWVTVSNKTGGALTHFTASMRSLDPKIDCIPVATATAAVVPAGVDFELPTPFRITISALADRAGAVPPVACTAGTCSNGAGPCASAPACSRTSLDNYAATLALSFTADELLSSGSILPLELDLDIQSRAASTTTFSDGFETGFVNWVLDALDANRATNALSNGYRCRYSDPDFPGSNTFGETECYLGFAGGQATANDWHIHDPGSPGGGRAYAGTYSAHYGVHTSPGYDTYGLSQMDALRTKNPIRLAARVCRDDPAPNPAACGSDVDCTSFGGPCVPADPVLSFRQQIRLEYEGRVIENGGEQSDRAVVHAQVAGTTQWTKIYPYQNVYDLPGSDFFSACTFDPVDDGNNEDSPADWPLGYPSSTCKPEMVFTRIGNTGAYAPWDTGRASDGPGSAGALGPGTWVESRFDLSRFRGRSIRIRFLITSIKFSDIPTWEDAQHSNPIESDDGWYLDDVRVTQVLGSAATTVSADTAIPPSAAICDSDSDGIVDGADDCPYAFDPAPADSDGDGVGDACDPCPDLAESTQRDSDGDGIGDACDPMPGCRPNVDSDLDGRCDSSDDCPTFYDPMQSDRDGDLVGDSCDDCPAIADATQVDSDGDGIGDVCDACPLGADGDGDGVVCPGDNCPALPNVSQVDGDGDGIGNVCDACPSGAGSDRDGDGICDAADNCPSRSNPEQTAAYELDRRASGFLLSSDGSTVVYTLSGSPYGFRTLQGWSPSDGASPGVASVSPSGGPPRTVLAYREVRLVAASPDGEIALLDRSYSSSGGLHVVSTRGGAGNFLESGFGPAAFTPDGATVLYWISQGGGTSLVRAPVAGGAPTILHGPLASAVPWGIAVSPDGKRVAYLVRDDVEEKLYSVPIAGGVPVLLGANGDLAFQGKRPLRFSPDSTRLVFSLSFSPVHSVLAGGGGDVELPVAGTDFAITPDSRFVFFSGTAQQAVPIEGGTVRTIAVESGPGQLSRDGSHVVYQTLSGSYSLYKVSFAGGVPTLLASPVGRFAITPDSSRVVWTQVQPGTGDGLGLYVVPIGGGPSRTLYTGTVGDFAVTADSTTVVFGTHLGNLAGGMRAARLDPDPDGDGVLSPCDGCPGIADPAQTDNDKDGATGPCDCDDTDPSVHLGAAERNDGRDNQCPGDPGYGSVDEVEGASGFFDASDRDEYSWNPQPGATSYQVARAGSADFATALACATTPDRSWTDSTHPAVGAAYFYLVRPTSPNAGSWGRRSTGAERIVPCP